MISRPFEVSGIARVVTVALCPGDDEAFVVVQCLCEESCHDEVGTDEEADLLLHTAATQHSSTHVLVRKVHLQQTAKM